MEWCYIIQGRKIEAIKIAEYIKTEVCTHKRINVFVKFILSQSKQSCGCRNKISITDIKLSLHTDYKYTYKVYKVMKSYKAIFTLHIKLNIKFMYLFK